MNGEQFQKRQEIREAEMLIYKAHEYEKWTEEIPYFELPDGISIKPIPNFCGSIVRFKAQANNRSVSVYLDCYSRLGIEKEPYWEVHPAIHGYPERCGMNETDKLVEIIRSSLFDDYEE